MQGLRRARYNRDHRFSAENLSAYIDGELPAGERDRVERHLADCGDCRSDLRTLQATVNLMRAVPPRPVPRSFALPVAARAEQARHRRWNSAFGALRAASVTIAMLFLLVLGGNAALSSGLLALPSPAASGEPMALMAPADDAADAPAEDATWPDAVAPSEPYGGTEGVHPTIAQAAPSQEQPQPEAGDAGTPEDAAKPEAALEPSPTDTARALQPPLETWPGPQGERGVPDGGEGGAGGAGGGDPSAMGGMGGADGGAGGAAMPTMPRSSGVGEGDEEPTTEAAAPAEVEALSAEAAEQTATPEAPSLAEAPAEKQVPPSVPQPEPTPAPTEAAPIEPPAVAEAPVAPSPEPTAEPSPEALALERQAQPDEGAPRGAEAVDAAPLTHRESPQERALRAAPLAMGLLAGLFLIALAGTIWAGYKRTNV